MQRNRKIFLENFREKKGRKTLRKKERTQKEADVAKQNHKNQFPGEIP